MRIFIAIAVALAVGACSQQDIDAFGAQIAQVNLVEATNRDIDVAYRDLPFDDGIVYVVANEHGDLHTYSLMPCGGARVCGGTGHVGQVTRTADFYVVTGAYRDRTFYLSPGGDGILNWRGVNIDLAWN